MGGPGPGRRDAHPRPEEALVQLSDIVFALVGFGALLAGILPRLVERRPLSLPIAFLALGLVVFALPTGLPPIDPLAHPKITEHLTEAGVMVALMGAGLKIGPPIGPPAPAPTRRRVGVAGP